MEKKTYVPWDLLQHFMTDAFIHAGVPEDDAKICTDVLLESDRRGIESHGCNRFKPIYLDRIEAGIQNPVTNYEVVKDTPTTLVADAHNGMGMVASYKCMTSLIEKAKNYGMAMGAIRNSTHYGIAGYWASMASSKGMIGICGTNARPSIAPTFGVENMLGTNPLTFAIPTDEDFDFILDCATSIYQRGKIEVYARIDKDVPAGVVIGTNGESKTNAKEILEDLVKGEAALAPLGGIGEDLAGYKGYGYATVVEMLSSGLSAANFMKALSGKDEHGNKKPIELGHFFIVINPEFFMGEETLRKTTGEICRQLRASKKAPGATRIYTAGEKEYLAYMERKDKGVPLGISVQKEFLDIRDRYHLDYHFPFEDE
ncbi:Ldh family oxidoreductase [Sharpea azabuensis]|uniref:Ldh family oxidoreductase n=1 Tax=Sharpea azabuensis TaxID=322505 RepID=UPI00156BCCD3|nr:Ldh family oxidoreductase [Sharpea azabuensis]